MVDLNRAYSEVKTLPDEALARELENPTGSLPGYLIMAEMEDRKAIRGSAAGNPNPPSMREELLGVTSRQYSRGGIIAGLNPFNTMIQQMKNPQIAGGLMQEQINAASGGLPALAAAQPAGVPGSPVSLSELEPTVPGEPQKLQKYYQGGLASLRRV